MDAQLKKGVLPLCILFAIRREARYGYEIMGEVRAVFPDVYDGSIYTVLRRLAADGYASYGGLKSGVFGLEFGLQLFENALAKSLGCDLFYDRPATALRQT